MMFHNFGYGYILASPVKQVRDQIQNHLVETDSSFASFHLDEPLISNVVGILNSPKELRCFVALLKLINEGNSHNIVVVLPGLDESQSDIYSHWKNYPSKGKIQPTIDLLAYESKYVTDRSMNLIALALWRGIATVQHPTTNS